MTNYFSQNEIPHNLVIVKAEPLIENDLDEVKESSETLRVFIWPRKSSQGLIVYFNYFKAIILIINEYRYS